MAINLQRKRTYTPQYRGLHTKLYAEEAAIVYELATAMKIAVYRPDKYQLSIITSFVNDFRRENQNRKEQNNVTPEMVHSFIRHAHENKLTLEDFTG